ncbi:hypothetical protein CDAR_201401 [Caerostris darwini]|uniref:Uncharacterized protein n=1 Tax=Caerostris darwini TaxID=1538125 RepID=A0AAV4UTJ4_9ARAC|nr:hypothetical protein CDAR_201401 [Caerostris darwini]
MRSWSTPSKFRQPSQIHQILINATENSQIRSLRSWSTQIKVRQPGQIHQILINATESKTVRSTPSKIRHLGHIDEILVNAIEIQTAKSDPSDPGQRKLKSDNQVRSIRSWSDSLVNTRKSDSQVRSMIVRAYKSKTASQISTIESQIAWSEFGGSFLSYDRKYDQLPQKSFQKVLPS